MQDISTDCKNIFDKTDTTNLLLNSIAEGIVMVDAEGTIQLVNPSLLSMFGYNNEKELLQQKIEILIPSQFKANHHKHRTQYAKNPVKRPMGKGLNLYGKRKNNTEFPVEISLNHIQIDNHLFVMALISDITERKTIQQNLENLNKELEEKVEERTKELENAILELQHTNISLQEQIVRTKAAESDAQKSLKKARELSELKSRFVSMASHEFRTPLSSILSSATLIEKYTEEDKRAKHIKRIKASVKNLTEILNDFLSIEKLEAGKINIKSEKIFIADFSEELVEELSALLKKGQEIIYLHEGKNKEIKLDAHILKNVLINLLSNAIKYSQEAKPIHFSTAILNKQLKIMVKDNGIGIPEKEQQYLFTRFFRAHNAVNHQGTGLGLNIVKKYIDLLKGKITFKSILNEGTTFEVIIPLNS